MNSILCFMHKNFKEMAGDYENGPTFKLGYSLGLFQKVEKYRNNTTAIVYYYPSNNLSVHDLMKTKAQTSNFSPLYGHTMERGNSSLLQFLIELEEFNMVQNLEFL